MALANLGKESEARSRGKVHIGDIILKTRYQETFESPQHNEKIRYVMATVQIGNELRASKLELNSKIKDIKVTVNKYTRFRPD